MIPNYHLSTALQLWSLQCISTTENNKGSIHVYLQLDNQQDLMINKMVDTSHTVNIWTPYILVWKDFVHRSNSAIFLLCLPSHWGHREQIPLLKNRPFLRRISLTGNQTGCHKYCSLGTLQVVIHEKKHA